MAAFRPIGDQARWRIVYEKLVATETGGVITYEEIADALELDAKDDRHAIQMAVRRAGREHEEVDKRAIEAVPNVGYRMVEAPEHLRLARGHQKKASTALRNGHSKVVNVDLSGLEPETRHAFEVVARAFALQMDFNRRMDVRQRQLEDNIGSIADRAARSEEEIAELRARLERLERGE